MHEESTGRLVYRLRGLVEGEAEAEPLILLEPLSFYGEVDPETGRVHGAGESLAGRLLAAPGTRGSTVGPYVLYALSRRGRAPAGIVVCRAEPLLVAGAVMAGVPLASGLPCSELERLHRICSRGGCMARLSVEPPSAALEVTPPGAPPRRGGGP